jgi:hypothetical protein
MPWGRLDDGLYDHPKLDELGRDRLPAIGLWALAISWCNRRLTDGFVPADRVRLLGGSSVIADRLVTVGLFDKEGEDYRVHDFLQFNDSRADVEARRAADAERKRKSRGISTPSTPESQVESQVESQRDSARTPPVTRARPHDRARPDPTRPIENEKVPSPLTTRVNGAEPTLSKAELDAWRTFGPEWDTFRHAWIGRGFRLPPTGSPEGDDTSQRGLLYQVLDARPADLVRWVKGAPGGAKHPSDVIGYVLTRWHEVRAEAGIDEERGSEGGPSKGEAAESLADIIGAL